MRLSLLILIPIVVTILIVALLPLPSYEDARKVNVGLQMRVDKTGTPDVQIRSNCTIPDYSYHLNSFWFRSIRQNSPPANYSWHLQVIKNAQAGEVEWVIDYYWQYDLRAAYWLNTTYSFEAEVGHSYTFIVTMHYELPIGSGEVQGIHFVSGINVRP